MKYTYSEYRQMAWKSLEGKWGAAAIVMLIYFVIAGIIGSVIWVSWLAIALFPMEYAMQLAFLRVAQGGEEPKPMELFNVYRDNLQRSFLVELLVFVFTFLWTLLFVIPGIIKGYAYAMTVYIANDHPELTPREAMKKSEEMMMGHKWDLFVLDLTFIGWLLLCMLTFGLLLLIVQPYIYTAHAHFYLSLKGEAEPHAEETSSAKPETAPAETIAETTAAKKAEPAAAEPKANEPADDAPVASESSEGEKK